jgi:hypothetical protein
MQKEMAMATQPFGGRDELVTCSYCRRSPFRGKVEHKLGCPFEKTQYEEHCTYVRLYEQGYRQSYKLFGRCHNSHPSYKLGWETGKRDLEMERLEDMIDQERMNDTDGDYDRF